MVAATDDTFYRFPAGPELHEVCDLCNFDLHICHFCGDILTHAEARAPKGSSKRHPCYRDAEGD